MFDALRHANIDRQAEWCPDQQPDLSFRGNELAGEVGEACNVIKKLERERHGWIGSRSTPAKLAEELADVVICADLTAMSLGIDLGQAVIEKFNAISVERGLTTKLPSKVVDYQNPCAKIFTHKWLDPQCVENGCQSIALWAKHNSAVSAGERSYLDGVRDGLEQACRMATDKATIKAIQSAIDDTRES